MPDIETKVSLDDTKLKAISEELKKKYTVRVGVLGSKDARTDEGLSNATVGAAHEFGTTDGKIPERSFLRFPLQEKLPKKIDEIGDHVFKSLTEENAENFFLKLGIKAEEVVQEAFDTGGFGQWAPLSEQTIKRKGHDTILIDTVQLRRSITSEVVEK